MRKAPIIAVVLLSLPAAAAEVTYSGENALRLKCATMLSLTLRPTGQKDRLSPESAAKSRAAAAHLLEGLPGNNNDKARAMQAMADRLMLEKTPAELRADFSATLPRCAKFFPSDG